MRKKDDGSRSLERHCDVKLPEDASLNMAQRVDGGARRPRTVHLDDIADYTAALVEE